MRSTRAARPRSTTPTAATACGTTSPAPRRPSRCTGCPRSPGARTPARARRPGASQTNGDYVVEGGEFPKVNGIDQQGLVRFAKRTIAGSNVDPVQKLHRAHPDAHRPECGHRARGVDRGVGPRQREAQGGSAARRHHRDLHGPQDLLRPRPTGGTGRRWRSTTPPHPRDRARPTGSGSPTRSATASRARRPRSPSPPAAPAASTYADNVMSDNPSWFWRMSETSGTAARDRSGSNDLTLNSSVQRNISGALLNQSRPRRQLPRHRPAPPRSRRSRRTGSPARRRSRSKRGSRPTRCSGGKIIGFGNNNTGRSDSNNNDRVIYMTNSGNLRFGVRPDMGTRQTIAEPLHLSRQPVAPGGRHPRRHRHEALRRRQPRRQQRRRHQGPGVPRLLAGRRRQPVLVAVGTLARSHRRQHRRGRGRHRLLYPPSPWKGARSRHRGRPPLRFPRRGPRARRRGRAWACPPVRRPVHRGAPLGHSGSPLGRLDGGWAKSTPARMVSAAQSRIMQDTVSPRSGRMKERAALPDYCSVAVPASDAASASSAASGPVACASASNVSASTTRPRGTFTS